MALELRPNCEGCDRDLPANAIDAMICTYECTYCAHCVEALLANVCPNCGGGFAPRPIRPATEWRDGLSLAKRPAGTQRRPMGFTVEEVRAFSARLKSIPPAER